MTAPEVRMMAHIARREKMAGKPELVRGIVIAPRHPLAARDVPPGADWAFHDHPDDGPNHGDRDRCGGRAVSDQAGDEVIAALVADALRGRFDRSQRLSFWIGLALGLAVAAALRAFF